MLPRLAQAWVEWQCKRTLASGLTALLPAAADGRLHEAPWDAAAACGPAQDGRLQQISLQVRPLGQRLSVLPVLATACHAPSADKVTMSLFHTGSLCSINAAGVQPVMSSKRWYPSAGAMSLQPFSPACPPECT